MDRRGRDIARVERAAGRGHDQHPAGEAGVAQPLLDGLDVRGHHRLERGVEAGRGGAAVLAHARVELVRDGDGHAGEVLGDELGDAQLVRGVDDRPQQADRHGLHPALAQRAQQCDERRLVERLQHATVGADPLRNLEGQRARDVRLRVRLAEVEDLGPAALAEQQDVGVSLGGEEGRPRRRPGEDGVEAARGPVDEDAAGAEQLGGRDAALAGGDGEDVEDALHRISRDGRALVEGQAAVVVLHDEIGERSTGVDGEPHGVRLTAPDTLLSIRTTARIANRLCDSES